MITVGTCLVVTDNSGAQKVKCIKVLGGSSSKKAKMNEICVVSVKQAKLKAKMKIEAGQVHKALILETKKGIRRKDGSYLKCFRNAAILLNPKNLPIATRISALSTYELRKIYGVKFLSLSGSSI